MSSALYQHLVEAYLDAVNRGEASMEAPLIDEACKAFREAMEKQFNRRNDKWRLRMSNLGRPVCQLYHERAGTPSEPMPANHAMRMVIGDVLEAVLLAVLRASGVPVDGTKERARLKMNLVGDEIVVDGTTDFSIAGEVWDGKTMSSFAFSEKGDPAYGYRNMKEEDPFGYLVQGFGYSEGLDKRFGGWVCLNKETGDISFVPVPAQDHDSDKEAALAKAKRTVLALMSGENPGRCFEDEPEKFRSKETGNRVLGRTCSYCRFKQACWPEARQEPQAMSAAQNPKLVWYTHLKNKRDTI